MQVNVAAIIIFSIPLFYYLWCRLYYVPLNTIVLRKRFGFSNRFTSFSFLKFGYNPLIPFIDQIARNNAKRAIQYPSVSESEQTNEISCLTADGIWLGIVLKYAATIEDDTLFINANTSDSISRKRWLDSLNTDGIVGYIQLRLIEIAQQTIKSNFLIPKESKKNLQSTNVVDELKSKFARLIEANNSISELKKKEGIKISKIGIHTFIIKLDLAADHETMAKIWTTFSGSYKKAKEEQMQDTIRTVIQVIKKEEGQGVNVNFTVVV